MYAKEIDTEMTQIKQFIERNIKTEINYSIYAQNIDEKLNIS